MADPFVAEIRIFPFNFAPKGWAFCNGQLLPISQNTALFSLLGTFYGGDGRSTFALPNLQGNVPLGQGQGPGLSDYVIGQQGGSPFVTLLQSEMPAHSHSFTASTGNANVVDPTNALIAKGNWSFQGSGWLVVTYSTTAPNTQMDLANAISIAGGSQPHNNMMPYLTLNFCIALQGVFPPRT